VQGLSDEIPRSARTLPSERPSPTATFSNARQMYPILEAQFRLIVHLSFITVHCNTSWDTFYPLHVNLHAFGRPAETLKGPPLHHSVFSSCPGNILI
jgi:hypothetical protein